MKDSEGNWLAIEDVVEYWVVNKEFNLEHSRMGEVVDFLEEGLVAVQPCGFTDEYFQTIIRPSTAFRKLPTCAGVSFMIYTTREIA